MLLSFSVDFPKVKMNDPLSNYIQRNKWKMPQGGGGSGTASRQTSARRGKGWKGRKKKNLILPIINHGGMRGLYVRGLVCCQFQRWLPF